MNDYNLESTQDSPAIQFDYSTGNFIISERSYPEDAFEFYLPVLKWIEEYITCPQKQTTVTFDFEYFNTQSGKQIFKIMLLLEELSKNSDVKIIWKYNSSDIEMYAQGEIFSKIITVPFTFEEIQ